MTPLISGEIGEDPSFYLTEANKLRQQLDLMSLLDEDDKVQVAGGFLLQVNAGKRSPVFEKACQKCNHFLLLESDDHIKKPFSLPTATEPLASV